MSVLGKEQVLILECFDTHERVCVAGSTELLPLKAVIETVVAKVTATAFITPTIDHQVICFS